MIMHVPVQFRNFNINDSSRFGEYLAFFLKYLLSSGFIS